MRLHLYTLTFTAIAPRLSNAFLTSRLLQSTSFNWNSVSPKFALLAPCLLLPQITKSELSTTSCSSSENRNTNMNSSTNECVNDVDVEYPGTAVQRLRSVHERVATLSERDLSSDWEDVRRKILWAGGLKDLPDAIPGQVSCFEK